MKRVKTKFWQTEPVHFGAKPSHKILDMGDQTNRIDTKFISTLLSQHLPS